MSEVTVINQGEEEPPLELPPGFRFHPTDEEVCTHYLIPKALNHLFSCVVIADVDLNRCEPWHLPGMAKMGEKEWYFFVHKDRKYPTGMRTNRATESGYWKATGKDKEIFRGRGVLIGMKKTLVFYLGRAPRGEKTPWVMHEYRLDGKLPPRLPHSAKDEWAVCRVFNKDLAAKNAQTIAPAAGGMERRDSLAFLDYEFLLDTAELPALLDSPCPNDDFKGGASTSAGAGALDMSGYQVKTEQQLPPQEMANQSGWYFSMPAPNCDPGDGYSHHLAAAGDQVDAIRPHCKAKASPTPLCGETDISSKQYLDQLEEMCPEDYYSSMWKA